MPVVNFHTSSVTCVQIFAPALFQVHWYCYVLDTRENILHVLDSLGGARHRRGDQKKLDDLMVRKLVNLARVASCNMF